MACPDDRLIGMWVGRGRPGPDPVAAHVAACRACAAKASDREMQDGLWALKGREPAVPSVPAAWRWAVAAAGLLAVGFLWRGWEPEAESPRAPATPVPPEAPALGPVAWRAEGGLRGFRPGRGLAVVLDAGSALEGAWAGDRLDLAPPRGRCWIEVPAGLSVRMRFPEGELLAADAAFAVVPGASSSLAWGMLREAAADASGDGVGFEIAVSRGSVRWAPAEGRSMAVGAGEVLLSRADGTSGVSRDLSRAARLCDLEEAWRRTGWQEVRPATRLPAPAAGMARVEAGVALPAHYEMEVRMRRAHPSGGGGLVYEAWGRRPVCMLPGDGWHLLHVAVTSSGVELRVDGKLVQVLAPRVVATAPTLETGLAGAGIAAWQTAVEIEGWRWRALED